MASLISSTGLNSRNNKSNSRTILSVVVLFVCVSVASGLYDDLGLLGVRVRPQRSSFRSSVLRTMFNKDRAKQDFYQPKCLVAKQQCDRWNTHCCAGLQCMTHDKGFCTPTPFEPCACFPVKDYMGERGGIWYKRAAPFG